MFEYAIEKNEKCYKGYLPSLFNDKDLKVYIEDM